MYVSSSLGIWAPVNINSRLHKTILYVLNLWCLFVLFGIFILHTDGRREEERVRVMVDTKVLHYLSVITTVLCLYQ